MDENIYPAPYQSIQLYSCDMKNALCACLKCFHLLILEKKKKEKEKEGHEDRMNPNLSPEIEHSDPKLRDF